MMARKASSPTGNDRGADTRPLKTGGTPAASGQALADKLARLSIVRDADLVLHLPLRYEDHTTLIPLPAVKVGATVQTEGRVVTRRHPVPSAPPAFLRVAR